MGSGLICLGLCGAGDVAKEINPGPGIQSDEQLAGRFGRFFTLSGEFTVYRLGEELDWIDLS